MMSLINSLMQREILGKRCNFAVDFAVNKLWLSKQYLFNDTIDSGARPLASHLNGNVLAVANENGDIAIINKHELNCGAKWMAHNNAVFDIKWRPYSDNHLVTASGDKSIIIWDVKTSQQIEKLDVAHTGSIKSINFDDNNLFASCARDGFIKIWDLRCCSGGAVMIMESAHLSRLPTSKSNSPKCRSLKPRPNTVTCVLFHPLTHHLYSSGENDATIKVWDLRKQRRIRCSGSASTTPLRHFGYKGSKNSGKGFSSLTFTNNYSLLANCTNNNVYGYYKINDSLSNLPTYQFTGHKVDNFTRISALCDNYLVSGSTDGNAYIWSIDWNLYSINKCYKVWPICTLVHTEDEVTAVECDHNSYNIYTCSDDQTVSKWSLHDSASNLGTHYKCQMYERNAAEIEVLDVIPSPISAKSSNVTPFSSLTNWLSISAKDPTNKRKRTQSNTPNSKSYSKENSGRKSSKRKLFDNNRRISDYFNSV